MPFSFSTSSDLPFNQTTVNPWDFLYCFCCGHYNSVLTSSSAFSLNSKCVYTPLLISEPEVNRQVKSQRRLGEFCIWAHLGGTCPLSHYREKLLHWRRFGFGFLRTKGGQVGYEWREYRVLWNRNTICWLRSCQATYKIRSWWLMTLYARIHPECLHIMPSAKFVHTTTAHKHTQKRHRLCGGEMLSSVTSICWQGQMIITKRERESGSVRVIDPKVTGDGGEWRRGKADEKQTLLYRLNVLML